MNKKAFTLLEVIMALLILVSMVTIFTGIQFKALARSSKERAFLDRVFIVQEELFKFYKDLENKKKKKEIKDIENPEVKIGSYLVDIDKKSSLNTFIDNVKIIKSQGSWKESASSYNIPFLTFVRFKEDKNG